VWDLRFGGKENGEKREIAEKGGGNDLINQGDKVCRLHYLGTT